MNFIHRALGVTFLKARLWLWLSGWALLVDAFIGIVSLGLLVSTFSDQCIRRAIDIQFQRQEEEWDL